MNTPPMAGVTTKYWYRNTATMATGSVRALRSDDDEQPSRDEREQDGIHRALLRISDPGARGGPPRTSSGRNASRNALADAATGGRGRAGCGRRLARGCRAGSLDLGVEVLVELGQPPARLR